MQYIFLYKLFSKVVQQEKDNEEYYRKYYRRTNAPFTYNRPQWRAYQEQYQHGNGHGDLFVVHHLVHAQVFSFAVKIPRWTFYRSFYGVAIGDTLIKHRLFYCC